MNLKRRQHGLSLIGLILAGGVLFFVALVGMKMVPTYLEYFTIKRHLNEMAHNSSGSSPAEMKGTFGKRATIDDITSVDGSELEFSKNGDGYDIALNYTKRVPLMGHVSLLFDFEISASR
jgi:hypothetical protein